MTISANAYLGGLGHRRERACGAQLTVTPHSEDGSVKVRRPRPVVLADVA